MMSTPIHRTIAISEEKSPLRVYPPIRLVQKLKINDIEMPGAK